MTREFPDWQPFPLDGSAAPPLELSGMRGSTLVLLGLPGADASGWAVRAAGRIARQRAGRTPRLLLADLDLEQPRLHMEVGADNDEGASDVLLYGASLGRVARPVDPGFLFVPAGTAVADTSSALTSPRLGALMRGFEEAGAELFLYLPWASPARDSVLAAARNLVLLAERDETHAGSLPELSGLRIGAVLGPIETDAAPIGNGGAEGIVALEGDDAFDENDTPVESGAVWESGAVAGDDAPGSPARPDEAVPAQKFEAGLPLAPFPPTEAFALPRDLDPADLDLVFRAGGEGAAPAPSSQQTGEPDEDPDLLPRVPGVGRRVRWTLVLLGTLLVAAVTLVVAALLGVVDLPGIPALAAFRGPTDAREASAASVPVLPGGSADIPIPGTGVVDPTGDEADGIVPGETSDPTSDGTGPTTSVAIGSYRDIATASARAAAVAAGSADVLVYVAPVQVDGIVWFRLLADARERVPEEELARVVARSLGGGSSDWFLRDTRLAFALGDAPTLEAARARLSELSGVGVPAYVLQLGPESVDPTAQRSPRFRVYAGGYASQTEAASMAAFLEERGIANPSLVTRTGRIPLPPADASS